MDVVVRAVQPSDRGQVLALGARLVEGVAPWREREAVARTVASWVAGALDDVQAERPVWVAVAGEVVVGFVAASISDHWSGERDAYIGELVTDQGWQGRGVGRRLVEEVEGWARSCGLERIRLETGAANAAARTFYDRLGFATEEVVLSRAVPDR